MIEPGTRIGGLLIEELLGRGAMGEVYRAVQVSLKRPVAVKRIAGHLVDNPDMVARFEREAQCIARIQHTNVVGIYEFGQYADAGGGQHFLLVMELVEGGRSLKSYLHGAMDWRVATSVMLQTAEGLAAAAEQGVVHRDIKPDNIMITKKGIAKLTDFGLAKAVDSSAMTMGGTLLGTPAYMPPEACRGEATDHRGDLYSLGATWYHLLSGQVPFRSDNTMAMLRAHLEEPAPNILALFPAVPEPIADLVRRCMAKKPEDRPSSALQLANELKALVAQGIHLKQAVPELVDLPTAAAGDPSTIATLVAGSAKNAATAATALVKPAGATPMAAAASAASAGPAKDRSSMATIQQPAAAVVERERVSPMVYLVPMIALVVLVALVAWAWSAFAGGAATAAPVGGPTTVANPPPSASPPGAASLPPAHITRTEPAPTPIAPGHAEPAPAPAAAPPSAPLATAPVSDPPVPAPSAPAPVAAPAPAPPIAIVAPPVAPPPPASPNAPPSQPPPPPLPASLATLPPPPPPLQLHPPQLIRPAREAAVTDSAITEFRAALRNKRALRAEAYLSSIAADAGGYKDMVRNLTQLKTEQDAAFAGLSRAAAGGQATVLLEAMAQATAFPELSAAIGQCRGWITLMEERWKAALARADEAIGKHDTSSASALLGEVPADPAALTAPFGAQRAAIAAKLAAAGR